MLLRGKFVPIFNISCRSFGSRRTKKQHQQILNSINQSVLQTNADKIRFKQSKQLNKKKPLLSNLLKQFYLKVHPDVIGSINKTAADVNNQSVQELNSFFQSLIDTDEPYPPKQHIKLPFYIRTNNDNKNVRKVFCRLQTNGGNCKNTVSKALQEFWLKVGLNHSTFIWDQKYWKPKQAVKWSNDNDDDDNQ